MARAARCKIAGLRLVRLYTGEDGRSHFEDTDLPDGEPLQVGPVRFLSFDDHTQSLHPAAQRQLIVVLHGRIEIGCADGDFAIGTGEIMLADDTTGEGHTHRMSGGVRTAVLPLPL
jgi:hypothetical protein